uniref:Serine-threonine/tyrosine-protein kinase catalytic domain-containing protein n=1 Tax=Chenopodium quinoa TaxID=63459 RepID=A0A803MG12_CHEQI
MSPEYACEGYFSIKSDVFSFGVVVLETISGRRNSRTTVFEEGLNLLGHAWRLWYEDRGLEFIDPTLKESCNPTEVLKCIYLGLLCVQDDPVDRPTMPNVVLMLSSSNESTANQSLPKKPSFFSRSSSCEAASSSSQGGFSSINMITVSTVGR